MQTVERRIYVRDEELRWQRREQSLSVGTNIRGNLGTLANANLYVPHQNMLRVRRHGRTFLSRPRIKTGSIFRLSLIDNCALAPAPAAVMLLLYAASKSTNRWLTNSRLSSSLCVSDRSTALLAKKVASAIWSAEA